MALAMRDRHWIDGLYADVETAKAAAREEERRRREEEERQKEEEEERQEEQQAERREERQEEKREQHREDRREEERHQEERRRREEEEKKQGEEEERKRGDEEERKRREEEEQRRREEEERRRREEEELRRQQEEERRKEEMRREEEEQRRREEEERRRQEVQQQLMTIEEETALIRQTLEEQRHRRGEEQVHIEKERRQEEEERTQVAPGDANRQDGEERRDVGSDASRQVGEEGQGGGSKQIGFEDVVRMLHETGDPRRVVERLREMGYEVEEVSDQTSIYTYRYGWVVKVGDRYIAISSGHRVGYGDVGDYVAMELPDEGAARNFLIGRYWGTSWGDPEFARRAAEAAVYERELDRWMQEELGKLGYRVERVEWPERALARGFTYMIYDKEGRKVGEVQVSKLGFKYGLIGDFPPAVRVSGDPRVAAMYLVYRHEIGDENLAWRLATGDERAKELYKSKMRYEQELKIREQWFKELSERGLKPIAYSKIDGRPVVSENDLFLDEKTGVTYRVVFERQGDRVKMKLVPATERDERLLALKSLESEGYRVVDGEAVEKDGVRYIAHTERQDGRYVVRLAPVGPTSPGEKPYRRGDRRGSLETLMQVRAAEELEERLRFGPEGRPRDVPYVPVLDEAAYGAFGAPLSQALLRPAGRELYQRYGAATLPGPRVQGFTLPERQSLERAEEIQRLYVERFKDVWTPLTLRAPTERDVGWRTAVATATEALTFWIPVAKGATALAAARGVKIPGLTAEKTATVGRAVRLPEVPGDYFEVHYVEPRKAVDRVRGALIAEGVGEGAATRGQLGHWEFLLARTGKPGPGWAFEFAAVTYRDVAEWLRKIPSVGVSVELKPKTVRFTEVRGFARDLPEIPRFEPPRVERPREVKLGWRVGEETTPKAPDDVKPSVRETPKAEPEPPRRVEAPRRGLAAEVEEVGRGQRAVAKVAQVEDSVRPVRAELPVAVPVKTLRAERHGAERLEMPRVVGEMPAVVPVRLPVAEERVAERRVEERGAVLRAEPQLRERELTYYPATQIREFTIPRFETPSFELATAIERERALETRYDVWAAEVSRRTARTADVAVTGRHAEGGFTAPPPHPPYAVRGGYGGWRETARVLQRPPRLDRRGWRVYEVLRI